VSRERVEFRKHFSDARLIYNNLNLRYTQFSVVHNNVLQTKFKSVTSGPQLIDCEKVSVITNETSRYKSAKIKS